MSASPATAPLLPRVLSGSFLFLATLAAVLYSAPGAPVAGAAPANPADTAWMLAASALVLLMTPGLAFFYGGMISKAHLVRTMMQSFIAIGVVSLLWIGVGFSLAFGDSIGGLIGDPTRFFMMRDVGLATHATLSPTIPFLLFALFQMKFAIITPALVTGAYAERVKLGSFVAFMVLFGLFVYAPIAHWTWHPDGILRKLGVLDFAGGTVVHMAAGFAGLAGAFLVRKRKTPHDETPSNVAYVLLGTGLLWFGWFGFNAGSALGANESAVQAFITTNTAAAAAMVAWVLADLTLGRKPSAIGAVVGLVAITPAAGFVSVGASVAIGMIAAVVSNAAVILLRGRVADTLDVFACHGVGGLVGMLLTAVFAKDVGLVATGDAGLLVKHVLAASLVGIYTLGVSAAIYKLVGLAIGLKTPEPVPYLQGAEIS